MATITRSRSYLVGAVSVLAVLVFVASTAAARPGLLEHCRGRVLVAAKGVKVGARRIRVKSTTYNPTTYNPTTYNSTQVKTRAARPLVGCRGARRELRAFMLADLERPTTRCADPAETGSACKVEGWLCSQYSPLPRPTNPASYYYTCMLIQVDRQGVATRLTYIHFLFFARP